MGNKSIGNEYSQAWIHVQRWTGISWWGHSKNSHQMLDPSQRLPKVFGGWANLRGGWSRVQQIWWPNEENEKPNNIQKTYRVHNFFEVGMQRSSRFGVRIENLSETRNEIVNQILLFRGNCIGTRNKRQNRKHLIGSRISINRAVRFLRGHLW